jgi:hypothetical protein
LDDEPAQNPRIPQFAIIRHSRALVAPEARSDARAKCVPGQSNRAERSVDTNSESARSESAEQSRWREKLFNWLAVAALIAIGMV